MLASCKVPPKNLIPCGCGKNIIKTSNLRSDNISSWFPHLFSSQFPVSTINDLMEENSTPAPPVEGFPYPPNFPVPIDLFVSKKRKSFGTRGFIRFTDPADTPVYTVHKFHRNSTCIKRLVDSSANTLFSIVRVNKGSWQGFKGNDEEKHLSFTVERTVDQFSRTEFKILLVDDNNEGSKTELLMKGCPFKRACTIYKDDSIIAETSLMNKLGIGKHFVPRSRFRVTIFPAGFNDHSFVASLVVIYFDGRKLWI